MPFKVNQDRRHHIPRQRHRQLARVSRRPPPARKPHRLVYRCGDRGREGRTSHDARWAATLFDAGHHDGVDVAGCLPPGSAADRGVDRFVIRLLGLGLAAPDHSTLSRRAETLPVWPQLRSVTGPMHSLGSARLEALRPWRVADREALHEDAPVLEKASHRYG